MATILNRGQLYSDNTQTQEIALAEATFQTFDATLIEMTKTGWWYGGGVVQTRSFSTHTINLEMYIESEKCLKNVCKNILYH